MKLHQDENFVLSNSTNEKKFTIAASAKAFKILSSSLYSRKVEAIVRELSCNAYDSHVFAGKADVPFAITLPTTWEPEFSVEDFGVGLDKQEVEEIYTSYFTSTKTDSNDVIGALGLGSKTPFSYTDTFTIRTRKNGKEYCYNAYISAAGEPAVSLVAECDTDQPNGVKVTVPVKSNDNYEFRSCCEKVYSAFRVDPIITNGERSLSINKLDFARIDEHGFTVVKHKSKNTVYALMGNVLYEVTNVTKTFAEHFAKDAKMSRVFENMCIIVKFDIGELDVAASRETISFDEVTEKNFLAKLSGISTYVMTDAQEKLDACTSISEAMQFADQIGEWAFSTLKFRGYRISELERTPIGSVIVDLTTEVYKPITLQPYVREAISGKIRLINGVPEKVEYSYTQHLVPNAASFYQGRSQAIFSGVTNAGGVVSKFQSGKVVIYEGWEDGMEAAVKAECVKLRTNFGNPYRHRPLTVIARVKLHDDLKAKLVAFFGKDHIEFKDSKPFLEAHLEEKKQARAERRAAQLEAAKAAGVTVTTKTVRIKKTEIHLVEKITMNGSDIERVTYPDDCKHKLDVAELASETALVFTRCRQTYHPLHTKTMAGHDIRQVRGALLCAGATVAYIIHSSDKRSIELAIASSVDMYTKIEAFTKKVQADPNLFLSHPSYYEMLEEARGREKSYTGQLHYLADLYAQSITPSTVFGNNLAQLEQYISFRSKFTGGNSIRYDSVMHNTARVSAPILADLTKFNTKVLADLERIIVELHDNLVRDDLSKYLLDQKQIPLLFNYLETLDKLKTVV